MDFNKEKIASLQRDSRQGPDSEKNSQKILRALREKDRDLINYIEDFKRKGINQKFRRKDYDILVYTVGFSPYTTLLSLSLLNPREKVIFLYTKESREKYEDFYRTIIAENFDQLDYEAIYVENGSDTIEGYSRLYNSLKDVQGKEIAIDITGGKKPTVAIGFLVASLLTGNNVETLYLDFKEYSGSNPEYGSEFLNILLNPMDIFSEVDRKSLEDMYRSKNFKGARLLSENIMDRMERNRSVLEEYNLLDKLDYIKKVNYFSGLYEKRYNFNYDDISINSKKAVMYLNKEELEGLDYLKKFYKKSSKDRGNVRDRTIINIYKNSREELVYAVLDRYESAVISSDLDLQTYVVRLVSVIELAGIVNLKSQVLGDNNLRVIEKIHAFSDSLLKKKADLLDLNTRRNNLSIIHGSSGLSKAGSQYEEAVWEYIDRTFSDFGKDGLEGAYNKAIKYRSYDEIFK